MELDDLLATLDAGETVTGDSPFHEVCTVPVRRPCVSPGNSMARITSHLKCGSCWLG